MRRILMYGAVAALGLGIAFVFLSPTPTKAPKIAASAPVVTPAPLPERVAPRPIPRRPVLTTPVNCAEPQSLAGASADNAASLTGREWSPWGRAERGWEIYLPLVAREIGSACDAGSPGFAQALSQWQSSHTLNATGVLTPATFEVMRVAWLKQRPFVTAFAKGQCPPAADERSLEPARKDEGYSGKPVSLTPAALAAYREMVEAARREVPDLAADRRLLTIFSAYRAPVADEARCDMEQSCGSITRARCSAHRTGTAVDLFVGAAPGSRPESSDDANRLFQSRSPAYRWLVANAERFGFVAYPFEPWHWEWTGG
ncbi:MAG: M15 family metallopeptidase [Caulobacteraceae bacterium]